MRASLVSREVIADSIELMTHAHDFDALVCLVGCDKTVPAALTALARVNRPAVVLSGCRCWRAATASRCSTIQDAWEAVGAPRPRPHPARAGRPDRARGAPGVGDRAFGNFTANMMAIVVDMLGSG